MEYAVLIANLIFESASALGPISSDFALLVTGWALGILSSPITDAIRRRSVKQRITRAIRTELRSLQDAFASVVVQISRRRGTLTHSLLDALLATLISSGQTRESAKSLKTIDDMLDGAAGERGYLKPSESPPSRTFLFLKVQGVPFLESHLHRLDFYAHETQRRLLEIHAGSQIFNQHADEAMHYHLMTFSDAMDQERLAGLLGNIEECYGRAAEKASELVSQIAVLLQSPEMRAA